MMNFIKFLFVGMMFGVIMTKSEIISWYRIYEMFRLESFHMFGIIGSAVIIGLLMVQWMKKQGVKTIDGEVIPFRPKDLSIPRYLVGGIIFGLGWALAGACPGPMFVLLGNGYITLIIVVLGALLGTFVYGLIRHRLPH